MSGERKARTPKFDNKGRKCIWEDCYGNRCNKPAKGYFFCESHLQCATNIDCCSYSGSDHIVVINNRGHHRASL